MPVKQCAPDGINQTTERSSCAAYNRHVNPGDALPLLRLLADGRFHSGDALATALGLSRATVCQRMDHLEALGIVCHRIRGRGYQLPAPLDLLDPDALRVALADARVTLECLPQVASTNTELLARADALASGHVLVTEWQTGGRGRQGRHWLAPPGQGLTFSLLWRFAGGVGALAGLSLAIGVALARACRECGVDGVQVKWPNDLLLHGRKLAGVLVEVQGDMLGPSVAVIGVGLNVHAAPALDEGQSAAALGEAAGRALSRNDVLCALIRQMTVALRAFEMQGFASFRNDWRDLHAWQGQLVEVIRPDAGRQSGIALDIDDSGALLIEGPTGVSRVLSGDVSLRPA